MLLEGIGFYKRPFKEQTNTARIIKQRKKLEELLDKGMSLREIGLHFNVSRGLIAHVFRELGLRSKHTGCIPKWIRRKGELLAMLRSGMKRAEIAKELGVTRNVIVGACYRLKLDEDEIVREKTREAVRQQMRILSKLAHAKRAKGLQQTRKKATKMNPTLSPWRFNMRAQATPPDSATRRTILELGLGHCRYPFDDVEGTFYCGAQTETELSSWCPYHAQFVFKSRAELSGATPGGTPPLRQPGQGVESPCSPANATRPHLLSEAA